MTPPSRAGFDPACFSRQSEKFNVGVKAYGPETRVCRLKNFWFVSAASTRTYWQRKTDDFALGTISSSSMRSLGLRLRPKQNPEAAWLSEM
jgi:hypothetical protein